MKKSVMKKSVIALLLCVALLFTACAKTPAFTPADMTVAALKGPTGVGMAGLMQAQADGKAANNYTFTVAAAADEISGKIVSGEINIASVPTNLAAKLYNKTEGKIQMLAVNTLGVLSIVTADKNIKEIGDLKGKTVFSTGEGSNPEYILRHVLKQNGIDPDKDVKLQFVATGDELVAAAVSGKAEYAMIPEPAATTVLTKNQKLMRVLDMTEEWGKVSDGDLMMGCVVALGSYVEQNKAAVDKFLEEYRASTEAATSDVESTAAACESFGIIPNKTLAIDAIPACNVTYVADVAMKSAIEDYFDVLFKADPKSLGGKLPGDDFYYVPSEK